MPKQIEGMPLSFKRRTAANHALRKTGFSRSPPVHRGAALDSVLRHEEPAGKPLVNFGLRVADRGMGCLHAERLNELQQGVAKGRARLYRLAQFGRRYALAHSEAWI